METKSECGPFRSAYLTNCRTAGSGSTIFQVLPASDTVLGVDEQRGIRMWGRDRAEVLGRYTRFQGIGRASRRPRFKRVSRVDQELLRCGRERGRCLWREAR